MRWTKGYISTAMQQDVNVKVFIYRLKVVEPIVWSNMFSSDSILVASDRNILANFASWLKSRDWRHIWKAAISQHCQRQEFYPERMCILQLRCKLQSHNDTLPAHCTPHTAPTECNSAFLERFVSSCHCIVAVRVGCREQGNIKSFISDKSNILVFSQWKAPMERDVCWSACLAIQLDKALYSVSVVIWTLPSVRW